MDNADDYKANMTDGFDYPIGDREFAYATEHQDSKFPNDIDDGWYTAQKFGEKTKIRIENGGRVF